MKKLVPLVAALLVTPVVAQETGCKTCDLVGVREAPKPTLKIRWKRLVIGEKQRTAPQHAATEKALDRAFATLEKSLAPLGVELTLQKAALSQTEFAKDPLASNRIWFNGAALAMYLPNAKDGKTKDAKTGMQLRTLAFAGKTFVDIPEPLIVHAGLIAAGESVKQALSEVQALATAGGGCCAGGEAAPAKTPKSGSAKQPECCEKPKKKQ